jgi:hypothetical protein
MSNNSEQVAIDRVQQRLSARFVQLPSERVTSAVQDALNGFAQSAVRDFVPLLVERKAAERLALL